VRIRVRVRVGERASQRLAKRPLRDVARLVAFHDEPGRRGEHHRRRHLLLAFPNLHTPHTFRYDFFISSLAAFAVRVV